MRTPEIQNAQETHHDFFQISSRPSLIYSSLIIHHCTLAPTGIRKAPGYFAPSAARRSRMPAQHTALLTFRKDIRGLSNQVNFVFVNSTLILHPSRLPPKASSCHWGELCGNKASLAIQDAQSFCKVGTLWQSSCTSCICICLFFMSFFRCFFVIFLGVLRPESNKEIEFEVLSNPPEIHLQLCQAHKSCKPLATRRFCM